MKDSVKSSENFTAVIGVVLSILFVVLLVWGIRSLPAGENNSASPEESANYEEYKSDQMQNENAEQEVCMDQMARDVERYGEQVADTYDCTR